MRSVFMMRDWASNTRTLALIEIVIAIGNHRSVRVAENRSHRWGVLRQRLLLHGVQEYARDVFARCGPRTRLAVEKGPPYTTCLTLPVVTPAIFFRPVSSALVTAAPNRRNGRLEQGDRRGRMDGPRCRRSCSFDVSFRRVSFITAIA